MSSCLEKEVHTKLAELTEAFNKWRQSVNDEIQHHLDGDVQQSTASTDSSSSTDSTAPTTPTTLPTKVINLNVGGKRYTTTLTTLTQQSDSMLGAMFSGRHELVLDNEKNVFIDRDGGLFKHVLSLLRDGDHWEPPLDSALRRSLVKEFDYYGLCCPKLYALEPNRVAEIGGPKTFTLNFEIQGAPVQKTTGTHPRGYELKVLEVVHAYWCTNTM